MASATQFQEDLKAYRLRQNRLRIWLSLQWRQARETWGLFSKNRLAVFGVALIFIYALMSITHPILMSTVWSKGVYDPHVGYDLEIFPHPSPPGLGHPLGTDTLGRDVLSRLLAATTPTFTLALTAALTTAIFSTLFAAFSAYAGGLIQSIQTHISDIFLLLPAPLVMIIIGGTIDINPFVFGLIYGLIAGLGGAAIVMRSQALTIIRKPYIEAALVSGASGVQIIFKHIIPNMLPLAAVQMLISVTGAVFADGFSTFLGISRTRLNWGSMIYDSFTYQAINPAITWNVLIPSALAISLFATAFYLIARGIHEVAEPRLRDWEAAPTIKKLLAEQLEQAKSPAKPIPPPSLDDTAPVRVAPRSRIVLDDQAAFAWLEYLAVSQGASEALLLRPEERRSKPPEWVTQSGVGVPPPLQSEAKIKVDDPPIFQPAPSPDKSLSIHEQARQAIEQGDEYLRAGELQQALDAYIKAEKLIRDGK